MQTDSFLVWKETVIPHVSTVMVVCNISSIWEVCIWWNEGHWGKEVKESQQLGIQRQEHMLARITNSNIFFLGFPNSIPATYSFSATSMISSSSSLSHDTSLSAIPLEVPVT